MKKYTDTLQILRAFFWRDWLIYRTSLKDNCINYGLLWPLTFGFSFAVLRKNILFSSSQDPYFGSMILVGSIVVPMMVIAYVVIFDLMFDLESRKHVLFQTLMVNPKLVLLQRIIFATGYTFFVSMLLFPALILFLGSHFAIQNHAWVTLALFMLLATCAMCALQQACATTLTLQKLDIFWIRFNGVMMNMGGAFITTSALLKIPFLGVLFFLNPVLHMTEGVRGILYPNSNVIPLSICCLYLSIITIVSITVGWILFKRRVDHI
ncbi:MAG TPA: hypothetical protein VL201_03000 [Patescibacteria group bacterium]|jgi:hypothetical protein|nr:hypothetical protein [Patescibacteria group bacterium]